MNQNLECSRALIGIARALFPHVDEHTKTILTEAATIADRLFDAWARICALESLDAAAANGVAGDLARARAEVWRLVAAPATRSALIATPAAFARAEHGSIQQPALYSAMIGLAFVCTGDPAEALRGLLRCLARVAGHMSACDLDVLAAEVRASLALYAPDVLSEVTAGSSSDLFGAVRDWATASSAPTWPGVEA